jgi:PhnB protein
MQLNAHLSFAGDCEAAFKFYEKCLGGKITFLMTYEESPIAGQAPQGWGKKILHAVFALGDQLLTGADVPPERYQKPQGVAVVLQLAGAAEGERIFQTLVEKGVAQMPLQETFWAERFGMLVDQFGTPWIINCGKSQ